MDIFSLFTLLGGLGFFLYGMSLMGSGLKTVAGGRLESILEKLSSTPLRGMLLGTVVTAIIQSSSATTVMVVGFVNSGIMKLSQAIGVIMGANIGTTATGWLLSLAGLEGTSVWVNLMKPTTFAPVLVLVGAAMNMFAKDRKKRSYGSILLGFGTLMCGMSMMSGAASPLADQPEFIAVLTLFENPLFGVLAGTVMTAVIQSASASIGILQALAITGTITYGAAIPLVLGMCIGACAPVLLSSIGANKNGKRTALIYLLFNAIGTIVFMVLFYPLDAIFQFRFLDQTATIFGVAVVNTVFNVFATVILLPLVGRLERLTCVLVRDDHVPQADAANGESLLDERFLASPGFALEQCKNVVSQMADMVVFNVSAAIGMIEHFDPEIEKAVVQNEDRADKYEDILGTYLVKLSARSLTEAQSREITRLLHSIGDLERISDHSLNVLELAREIHEKEITFSPGAVRELETLISAVIEILQLSAEAFQHDDVATASRVEPLEEVIDMLCDELKARHVVRLQQGVCTTKIGFVFNDLIANFERVADHCSNIAVYLIRLKEKGKDYDVHRYLKGIKTPENADLNRMFDEYRQRYYGELAGEERVKV